LDTASRPSGTVIRTSKEAASSGWPLTGNQPAAPCGWPAATAPSSVCRKPVDPDWLGIGCGTPE
jgi:hypothetical protein